jgi:molybdenum cofactor guanylyltransferase
MPFLNTDLLTYLINISPGYDAVIPKIDNFVEPLHGIYTKTCIDTIKILLDNNNLSVTILFDIVKTRFVYKDEINRIDPEHLSFFNINTEKDLFKANKIAEAIDI